MKKIFFAAMAISAMLAVSCSENTEPLTNLPEEGSAPQVRITLAPDAVTRAFFDETAAAEPWESKITSLYIYVFDGSGKLILKRFLTASEVSARSARFSVPNSAAGTDCSFYVAANCNYGDAATAAEMEAKTEKVGLREYNGAIWQIEEGKLRQPGFVMTGKATAAIDGAGTFTTVPVTLKRTVAKIAVRTSVAESFKAEYGGGTVRIRSVTLSNASALSNSFFNPGSYQPRPPLCEFTQGTDDAADTKSNIFYVYENGPLAEGERLVLTFKGLFDPDGNTDTSNDNSPVEYRVELNGSGGGEIRRNGYYRVDAVIRGISGYGLNVRISAADWEAPVTQTVYLGL